MNTIVTFYSYKGGVGRSMALANIAILLARRGLSVLAVDWDLEAPGLENYFSYFTMDVQRPGSTIWLAHYALPLRSSRRRSCPGMRWMISILSSERLRCALPPKALQSVRSVIPVPPKITACHGRLRQPVQWVQPSHLLTAKRRRSRRPVAPGHALSSSIPAGSDCTRVTRCWRSVPLQ
jgi:hypothetical protein